MMIRDDIGAEHPPPPIRAGVIPDPDHPATRAMLARIGDEMFGARRGCGVFVGYTLVMPFVLVLTCAGAGLAGFLVRSPISPLIGAAIVVVSCSFVLLRILTPDLTAPLARAMRHVGRCGSCCHPLAGAPSESGLTRCSECGAAWQTATIRDVHVREADLLGARRFQKALTYLRTPRFRSRDRRGRYVLPQAPRGRWMRGTPYASTARSVRWTMYGFNALGIAVVIAAIALAVRFELEAAGLFVVFAVFAFAAIIGSLGQPRLLVMIMRRHGLCPACSNALDEAKCCGACGAAWGTTLPPPPVPVVALTPPRAPPTAPPST